MHSDACHDGELMNWNNQSKDRADSDEPLILGPDLLRKSTEPSDQGSANVGASIRVPRSVARPSLSDLSVARLTENECILFDEQQRVSWILYPPRSLYSFVSRPAPEILVIEERRWLPQVPAVFHPLSLTLGCSEHGADCVAMVSVTAAINAGYDPFR
jgi:hypothetical protein